MMESTLPKSLEENNRLEDHIMVRMSKDLKEKISEMASENGLRIGPYIRFIMSQIVKEKNQPVTKDDPTRPQTTNLPAGKRLPKTHVQQDEGGDQERAFEVEKTA